MSKRKNRERHAEMWGASMPGLLLLAEQLAPSVADRVGPEWQRFTLTFWARGKGDAVLFDDFRLFQGADFGPTAVRTTVQPESVAPPEPGEGPA